MTESHPPRTLTIRLGSHDARLLDQIIALTPRPLTPDEAIAMAIREVVRSGTMNGLPITPFAKWTL
jgi:hypothetical protein